MKIKNRQLDALAAKLFYILLTLAALACVFVIVFAIKGPKRSMFKVKQGTYDIDISSSYATLDSTADYGQNYIDSITFLGDRTMQKMLDLKILPGGKSSHQVWSGEGGDIPLDSNVGDISVVFADSDEIVKLSDAISRRNPKYIIVTLGVSNGVSYCDKEKFCDYYQDVIDVLKGNTSGTAIIIQSILPVSKKAEKKNPSVTNQKIDEANGWIVELCEKNGLKFLNTAVSLKDENGRLHQEFVSDDGLSMNEDGYKKMLKYIRTHGYIG